MSVMLISPTEADRAVAAMAKADHKGVGMNVRDMWKSQILTQNIACYNRRYKDTVKHFVSPVAKTYPHMTIVEAHKALHYAIYQCEDEFVDANVLIVQQMRQARYWLEFEIVRSLREWEDAPWGD